ncbi:MAG: Redoxin domain protein [Planctomycetaceae bacterium]|nr:Redoxin domain protein [Planctomycetaceae bacterium]
MSSKSSQAQFFRVVGFAAVGTILFVLFLLYNRPVRSVGGIATGRTLPTIEAQGWLNGDAPKLADLQGQVLVIDAWATWCFPCRKRSVDLVYLHEKYAGKGVRFIGLTAEPESQLEAIRKFLKETGITWLNGYGAEATLTELGAEAIPMVWVFDRQGRVVWNEESTVSMDRGIQLALESKLE